MKSVKCSGHCCALIDIYKYDSPSIMLEENFLSLLCFVSRTRRRLHEEQSRKIHFAFIVMPSSDTPTVTKRFFLEGGKRLMVEIRNSRVSFVCDIAEGRGR
jgi:hypothetical protein